MFPISRGAVQSGRIRRTILITNHADGLWKRHFHGSIGSGNSWFALKSRPAHIELYCIWQPLLLLSEKLELFTNKHLVRQEMWGLLLTHFAVRQMMSQAAMRCGLDPDRLSFINSVRVLKRKLPQAMSIPPSRANDLA